MIYSEDRRNLLNDYAGKYFAEATIGEGNTINIIFDEIKFVGGMYPYNMAVINGKAMRIKGKTMKLNLIIIETTRHEIYASQIALIK